MSHRSGSMLLGLSLLGNGTHKAGWRHPQAAVGGALDFALWKQMAQAAELAKIHFIFLADDLAVLSAQTDEATSYNGRVDRFEPLTLLSGLAAVTERIGLIATVSTTYAEPYTVARAFASLDHLSNGRAGWNVVTSVREDEAANFSRASHLEHDVRYRRAEEFVDVVEGLWDSWDDDAFTRDKSTGRYFDPAKMHTLDHGGEFFAVRGPLNISRPPQGHPIVAQAGASEPGQRLAARTADVLYTVVQDMDKAREFYRSINDQVARAGRPAGSVRILPGLLPVVGRSQEEAEAKLAQLQELIDPRIGLSLLQVAFGDLSHCDIDGPLPDLGPTHDVSSSFRDLWVERARRDNLSIRQLYELFAINRGHCLMVGTPESIADEMQQWFENSACDGFAVLAPYIPGGLTDFLANIVPVLQKRGLFHTEYEGATLRQNLGLARPNRNGEDPMTTRELASDFKTMSRCL
jgi:FMN-dependent oxidoreductase (nitrilotriacetate monooxygenase family)